MVRTILTVVLAVLAAATAENNQDCKAPADIQFLLDASGSVGADNFKKQLDFVRNFVNTFEIGPNDVKIGLATFSTQVTNEFYLKDFDNKTELLNAIDNVGYSGGSTYTDLGIKFVRDDAFKPSNGDRPNAPNILIVTTDGQSNKPAELKNETDLIHKTNINVFSIGIGSNVNPAELQMIASNPNNVYQAADFDALVHVMEALKNTTCKVVDATTVAPATTPAPTTNACQNKPADIHFLIDSSGSVGLPNFQKQLEFVRNFTNKFPIGPNDVRVGLTTFSTDVHNQFFMKMYDNKQDLLDAISNVTYTSGTTYTEKGLEFVRNNAFTTANGGRDNAVNILIVTTDGQSTHPDGTKIQADLLHKTNINTFAIGVGSGVDKSELALIASDPSHVYTVDSFDALQGIQQALQLTACNVVVQEPEKGCGSNGGRADIHFLLDASGSIGSDNYQKQLDFVKSFAGGFDISSGGVQIGVSTFSSTAQKQFWMNEHHSKNDLLAAIGQIPYAAGNTHTELGLEHAREQAFTKPHGDRDGVANILVVVTDGKSISPSSTKLEADELHKLNMNVIAVGVGSGVDQAELLSIASDPSNVYTVSDFDALNNIKQQLEDVTCQAANNSRCNAPIDLLFLVDKSASIKDDQYIVEKEFIEKMIDEFHIGPNEVQVAVSLFANHVRPKWCFNNYTTQAEVVAAVKNLTCPECLRGQTATGHAINYARTHMLKTSCGARPNADKVVVLLTDGRSTEKPHTIVVNAADRLKRTGATVIAVGVGHVRQSELHQIASKDEYVFTAANFANLLPLLDNVAASACTALDYSPICNAQMDLTFLVDKSRSVDQREFVVEEEFIEQLIGKFKVEPNGVHVAMSLYARHPDHKWCFNDYPTANELILAVQNMTCGNRTNCGGGRTATGEALKHAYQDILQPACGMRPNVTQVVILLTDSKSSENATYVQQQAAALKATGAHVITVGVDHADHTELENIASNHSQVFMPTDFAHLLTTLEAVSKSACSLAPTFAPGIPSCSHQQKQKACALLQMNENGALTLSKTHSDGHVDNATPYQNIKDMCDGRQSSRSTYNCSACPTGAPGGTICISNFVLDYMTDLAANGTFVVNQLTGGCEECNSPHFVGMAIDLTSLDRQQEFKDICADMGGIGMDQSTSVQCSFA